jgi:SAM-dependent methyltransferase
VQLQTSAPQVNKAIDTYVTSPYESTKAYERFRFLADLILAHLPSAGSFLDIGCAKGEFIYYLRQLAPDCLYTGLDYSATLLALARQEPRLQGVDFVQGDAACFDVGKTFDVVLMSGVLSTFDAYEPPLACMVRHLKSAGYGYIFGGFTTADVDVIVRYRNNAMGSQEWESGLNMFSLQTIRRVLAGHATIIQCHKFHLATALPAAPNPITSFTVRTEDGGQLILNGANIVRDFYAVEFQKR